jgi:hypothetical protein
MYFSLLFIEYLFSLGNPRTTGEDISDLHMVGDIPIKDLSVGIISGIYSAIYLVELCMNPKGGQE